MISKGYELKNKDYKSYKQNSIKYITEFLSKFPEEHRNNKYVKTIEKAKKKDDLCDSLLQILAYFQK
jgi:hypothetical protein